MYFKQRNLHVGNFKFILQFPIAIQPILWVSYHRVPDSSLREGVDCSPNRRLNPGAPGSSNDIKIHRIGFTLSSVLSEKLPGLGWMMRLKQCRSTKISQLVPAYHNLVVEQLKLTKERSSNVRSWWQVISAFCPQDVLGLDILSIHENDVWLPLSHSCSEVRTRNPMKMGRESHGSRKKRLSESHWFPEPAQTTSPQSLAGTSYK